jgi:hypothetical protein
VPFGYYNERVKEAVKAARFEGVFTVYGQKLTYGSPNDSLGRYVIEANKPKVFEDAISFSGSSSGGSVPVEEIPAYSLQAEPADGSTSPSQQPLIKANLGALGAIDAGSAKMRVSGLGIVPSKYDAATQAISYQVTQPLHGDSCTVIVEAKVGGRKAEAHWSFSLKQASTKASAAPAASASPAASAQPTPKQ